MHAAMRSTTRSWSKATIVTSSPTSLPRAKSHEPLNKARMIDPQDIETAIENYRELYEFLIEDRAAP